MAEKKSFLKFDTTSLLASLKRIVAPIQRYHALIMFVLLMGVLIYSVYSVSTLIQFTDDVAYRDEAETKSLNTKFDQATIEKVDELRESNTNAPIELPGGRRNPFVD